MLVLEYNNSNSAKCRARKCLVQEQPRQFDEKIRSPYRLNLQSTQNDNTHWSQLAKPNRRFFHTSCFEAIGVDTAKYVTLPPERQLSQVGFAGFGISYQTFHPAIIDWVTNKGKAYDADLYGDYEETFKAYRTKADHLLAVHMITCSEGKCTCEPLVRPNSNEFLPGEPSERSLTDVLLHEIGAVHLMPLSQKDSIWLLEIMGEVPKALSKEAIAAAKQSNMEAEVVESGTAENGKVAEAEPRGELAGRRKRRSSGGSQQDGQQEEQVGNGPKLESRFKKPCVRSICFHIHYHEWLAKSK